MNIKWGKYHFFRSTRMNRKRRDSCQRGIFFNCYYNDNYEIIRWWFAYVFPFNLKSHNQPIWLFHFSLPTQPQPLLSPFSLRSASFSFSCDRLIGLFSACMMLLIARIISFCHFENLNNLILSLHLSLSLPVSVSLSVACHPLSICILLRCMNMCMVALRPISANNADKICENCTQAEFFSYTKTQWQNTLAAPCIASTQLSRHILIVWHSLVHGDSIVWRSSNDIKIYAGKIIHFKMVKANNQQHLRSGTAATLQRRNLSFEWRNANSIACITKSW